MTKAYVAYGKINENGALKGNSIVTEPGITPSGSNQVTTAVAPNGSGTLARITSKVDIWASVGATPNATTDTSRFAVLANQVVDVAVQPGHKVSVITLT